jgi:hypothetical protein
MPYTYVYIRDPESNACAAACVDHVKDGEKITLKLAFSFGSPEEKHFIRAKSREEATKRMEEGNFITVEKRKGNSTYTTVKGYLKYAVHQIDQDEGTVEDLLKIQPYKCGKHVSLTSEFWSWLFVFVERI